MLRSVAVVGTDVSEERSASSIKVTRMVELAMLAATSNWCMMRKIILMMDALRYSETSVPARATRRNIPEYGILHSHHREDYNLT
jgi:hypothetical protein